MKALILTLALALPLVAQSQTAPATAPVSSNRILVIELLIPAPVADVWNAFVTRDGLITWLAPDASVDLRPGGDWIAISPGGKTGGGTVVSFVPQHELVLSAMAPEKFPIVRATRTHAVFSFEPRGNSTLVRLTQTGWQDGPEWDAAYEYLASGNGQLLATLHRRFVSGPIDWQKVFGPAPAKSSK